MMQRLVLGRMRAMSDFVVDTFSFPKASDDPEDRLWKWLVALQQSHAERRVVPTPYDLLLPQVRGEDLDLIPVEPPGPGRLRRDPHKAAEVALAWDIEGFRPRPDADMASGPLTATSDRSLLVQTSLRFVHRGPLGWDSRTIRRWRDDGRRVWAAWGAWPWALNRPDGKLGRVWWREERYRTALRDWAEGRLP
jgi:hypothetical protein